MLNKNIQNNNEFQTFVKEIKERILSSQYEALKKVNKELIDLYWNIGKEIVAKQEAYGWGKSVVKNLSDELRKEFVGIKGFSVQNLWNMRQFYLEYYENQKLQPLVGEIGWSHNVAIFRKSKDDLERKFYILSTKKFGWTYRLLDNQIDNQTYEKYLLNQTNKLKDKNRTIVEYALKETHQPIGVATYKLSKELPSNLKEYLPTPVEIEESLLEYLGAINE